jgi:GMP synthase (glutamine-hydrolysing)
MGADFVDGSRHTACTRYLENTRVLHWMAPLDLPKKTILLASTEICANQAFSVGDHIIAFQFHPEAMVAKLEEWFIGHAREIASTLGISVNELRLDSAIHGTALLSSAEKCLIDWLESAETQR